MGAKNTNINVSAAAAAYVAVSGSMSKISENILLGKRTAREISESTIAIDPQTAQMVEEAVAKTTKGFDMLSVKFDVIRKVVDQLLKDAVDIDDKSKKDMATHSENLQKTSSKLGKR